ncbi:MAG TPA: hypothetical protein ENJ89_10000 [Caldithrix abyssi]|uniref:Prenyltransferase n=1 Tax=Caldithrix abyssi TaxID=187145 RepID=A0A7V5PRE4_CALAY|nr:hypothetical protein [Caldithrix abyssi]
MELVKDIPLRAIALPREHGAWGFVLEPLILALLVAFSVPALYLAFAALLAFFAHQPVKVLLSGNRQKRGWAVLFLLIYLAPSLFFILKFIPYADRQTLIIFGVAVLVMVIYLGLDILHYGRRLFVEIMAPSAVGLMAAAMVKASGWSLAAALSLWAILLARAIPTAFYVHAKIKQLKGQRVLIRTTVGLHIAFSLIVGVLAVNHLVPVSAVVAVTVFLARAMAGLMPKAGHQTVKQIGMREFGYGAQLVLLTAIGYWFNM